METIVKILAAIVGVLALLQGWQMVTARNRNKKTNNFNPTILEKLDDISSAINAVNSKLGRMEQRLTDIWDKIRE